MTIKKWCAISKAVEMVATTLRMSEGCSQSWLIEACATGDVRSRADSVLLTADDGTVGVDVPSGALRTGRPRIWRVAGPVSSVTWKNAVIDGDALVDNHHGRWDGVEISISDLEFELKQSPRRPETVTATTTPSKGRSCSDKVAIEAEAKRRLTTDGEKMPSSLSGFSRDLHFWLDKQPWAKRSNRDRKVLSPPSIEEHIRPLWRKYRGE
jgi:hypothetical protein